MTDKRTFWVPVRIVNEAYLIVEAYSPEDAVQIVESQEVDLNEAINLDPYAVAITGLPREREIC